MSGSETTNTMSPEEAALADFLHFLVEDGWMQYRPDEYSSTRTEMILRRYRTSKKLNWYPRSETTP